MTLKEKLLFLKECLVEITVVVLLFVFAVSILALIGAGFVMFVARSC